MTIFDYHFSHLASVNLWGQSSESGKFTEPARIEKQKNKPRIRLVKTGVLTLDTQHGIINSAKPEKEVVTEPLKEFSLINNHFSITTKKK